MKDWLDLPLPSAALLIAAFVVASLTGGLLLNGTDAVFGAVLAAMALYVSAVDLERFEIPDSASLAILMFGLIWSLEVTGGGSDVLAEILTRSGVVGAIMFALRALYQAVRKTEGLGLGDVKLAGAGAAWLSWSHTATALLLAAVAAILIVMLRSKLAGERVQSRIAVPFGAFLAPAIWVVWVIQVVET
jgi:leader peptidase (prepilin peptidase)/N-methyltransferase